VKTKGFEFVIGDHMKTFVLVGGMEVMFDGIGDGGSTLPLSRTGPRAKGALYGFWGAIQP
jgi:hypothetical protein